MRLPRFLRRPEPEPNSPQLQAQLDRAQKLRWERVFLPRPEPVPTSPQMQALLDRARELRWERAFQRGPSPEQRELDLVRAQITALRLEEAAAAAAAA